MQVDKHMTILLFSFNILKDEIRDYNKKRKKKGKLLFKQINFICNQNISKY